MAMSTKAENVGSRQPLGRKKRKTEPEYKMTDLLGAAASSEGALAVLGGALACRKFAELSQWRGRDCIPPASILDLVCSSFERGSNVPTELPFGITLHLISGHLLQRDVTIVTPAGVLSPKLWTILLADSSAGKSFSLASILGGLAIPDPEISGLASAVSAAAMFHSLLLCPRGLMVRDEFGQLVGRIETDPRLSDVKDLMLRLYDGCRMSWNSRKDGMLEIERPQVSILGLTQHQTWHTKVSAESLLDGFAARFSVLIARSDPSRKMTDHPIWKIDNTGWLSAWERCAASIQPRYEVTPKAEAFFCAQFKLLAKGCDLPEAFFRRILYSAHRLACIYHVIAANPSPLIDEVDYGWALRLVRHHLHDAIQILGEQNLGEIERICVAAEALRDRCKGKGITFDERALYRNFRTLNSQTARVIMRLISES